MEDLLWKNPLCIDENINKQLNYIPYWEMNPMILNQGCYPFLSNQFPYNNDGTLKDELNPMIDSIDSEDFRFNSLIQPHLGIDFVVPNNVHGGNTDSNADLFLYQPNMWSVYWHIRPAVCSMDGTDIPSTTDRVGGFMSDPVLNSMYCYLNIRDLKYFIPYHGDMNKDWLNSGWLIINGRVNDIDDNPDRDLYFEFDASVEDSNEERNQYWEIDASNIPIRP